MISVVAQGLKRVAKAISPFKELVQQRDACLGALNDSEKAKDSLLGECQALIQQRDQLIKDRGILTLHRDTAAAERDAAYQHITAVATELGDAIKQRNIAAAERDAAYQRITAVATELGDAIKATKAETLMLYGEDRPFVPNGHFYSPIPAQRELRRDSARIFKEWPRGLSGLDLREDAQRLLLEKFIEMYADLPFGDVPNDGLRYGYKNEAYSYSDGIFLNCMLRHVRPKRVVEVGSGYSSCMLLDTNERWFGNSIGCTFIEPYPKLLYSLLKPGDQERIEVLPNRVQDVEPSVFASLQENDVLFIDSTHVSKIGSDVNHLFFDVLPALAPGVYVHFHDIFYPFEYPRNWAEQGRGWNEIYLLRAFLQYNSEFEVVVFNTFLAKF
jgi:predicted O-methyltransferase YrrM